MESPNASTQTPQLIDDTPFPASISLTVFIFTGVLSALASTNAFESRFGLDLSVTTSALCFLSGLRLFHASRKSRTHVDLNGNFTVSLYRPRVCLIATIALLLILLPIQQLSLPKPFPAWLLGAAIGYLLISYTTARKSIETIERRSLSETYSINREVDDVTYKYHSLLVMALTLPFLFSDAKSIIDMALAYFAGLIVFVGKKDSNRHYKFLPLKIDLEFDARVVFSGITMIFFHAIAVIQTLIMRGDGSHPPILLFILAGASVIIFQSNIRLKDIHQEQKKSEHK